MSRSKSTKHASVNLSERGYKLLQQAAADTTINEYIRRLILADLSARGISATEADLLPTKWGGDRTSKGTPS